MLDINPEKQSALVIGGKRTRKVRMCESRNHFFHLINNKINNYRVCSHISHTFSALFTLADSHFSLTFRSDILANRANSHFPPRCLQFPGSLLRTLSRGRALELSALGRASRRSTEHIGYADKLQAPT